MERKEFLRIFARYRAGAPTIAGPGVGSREVFAVAHTDATLYQMDMSYATPLCLGLALANERQRFVAVEGDGSILTGLGVLTTIGRYQPRNLVVLVLDNQLYSSIESEGYPAVGTATSAGADVERIARACGIRGAVTVRTEEEAEQALARAMDEPGPWIVVAKVPYVRPSGDPRAVTPPDLFENSLQFAHAVREILSAGR